MKRHHQICHALTSRTQNLPSPSCINTNSAASCFLVIYTFASQATVFQRIPIYFTNSKQQIHNPRFSHIPKKFIMEALLSLSFDNLSSYDGAKIRKGLRQVEGLLAQICLSSSNSKSMTTNLADKRSSMISDPGKEPPRHKELSEITDDPAFREFFKLQEGFEWNVAMRLVNCLDRLLGKSNDGANDLLILACLDLIQGILLLHPPSRSLFSREIYMNVRAHTISSSRKHN
jgi:hypothetical protein